MLYLLLLSFSSTPKFYPLQGSYIQCEGIGYYNSVGSPELVRITVRNPMGDIDTTYSGILNLHSIQSNPNGSVVFISTSTGQPVDTVHLSGGEKWIAVIDYEPEILGIYVTDPGGSLKTSIPIGWFVDSCSAINIPFRANIFGPDTTNTVFSPGFFGPPMLYFSVVDSLGFVDTSSSGLLDSTVMYVKIANDPDSTAFFYNPIFDTLFREGNLTMFYGRGWLQIVDYADYDEVISVIAEDTSSTIDFSPDTLNIFFTNDSISHTVALMSGSGHFWTAGRDKVFYGLAFLQDGPDPTNNTSMVSLAALDPYGTNSVSVSPSGFVNLRNGAYSFRIFDTEPDSFVFLTEDVQGSPYLYRYNPVVVTSFKNIGEGVQIAAEIPYRIPINDTVWVKFYAVDAFYNFDSTYNGWLEVDYNDTSGNSSVTLLDTLNNPSNYFPFVNGKAKVGVFNSQAEVFFLDYNDAEGGENFHYLGDNLEDKIPVTATSQGTGTKLILEEHKNITAPYKALCLTVSAVDISKNIDTGRNDTVNLTVTGSASISPDTIVLNNGMQTFWVYDIVSEVVYITAFASGLDTAYDTLWFVHPDSAAYIFLNGPGDRCVNEPMTVSGYIMTPEMTLADYYNGYIASYLNDYTRSLSAYYIGVNSDSIPVNGGTFSFMMSDSEPEYVNVYVYDPNGFLQGYEDEATFYANLDMSLKGPHKVNIDDTITVFIRDINGNVIPMSSGVYNDTLSAGASQIGGYNPFSVNWPDGNLIGFTGGYGYVRVNDTEEESLVINVWARNVDWYHGSGEVSRVYYTGIPEDSPISISMNTIQKGALKCWYSVKTRGVVSIELFDITGRKVFSRNLLLVPGRYQLTEKSLPAGIYYLKIGLNGGSSTGKVILIK